MNQVKTVLHKGISQITVFIRCGLFNNFFSREQVGPRIQETYTPRRIVGRRVTQYQVQRASSEIRRPTKGISHIAWPQNGEHKIRSGWHAPTAKCHAEIILVFIPTSVASHIEEATKTQRGIDNNATQIIKGLFNTTLQQVVNTDHDITNIGEEVGDQNAQRFGQNKVITNGHRLNQHRINGFVHLEHATVITFPRVARVATGGAACYGSCQRYREQPTTQIKFTEHLHPSCLPMPC